MDKKTTRFNIVHGDNEYEIPEECEAAEEAAEELAKTNLEEHYSFINLLSIAVIMLFACIFFISWRQEKVYYYYKSPPMPECNPLKRKS